MRTTWWLLAVALGAVGGMLIHRRLRTMKNKGGDEAEDWPYQKNFGAFPPDLPESIFEG